MAIALIVEDGTGVAGANTYVALADYGAYAEAHLYADAYTAATDDRKNRSLVMAARTIDSQVQFVGRRATIGQALEWPRTLSAGRQGVLAYGFIPGQNWSPMTFDGELIPRLLKQAQCELAIGLLGRDRTADPDSAGIKRLNLGQQAIEVEFDATTVPAMLPPIVLAMLSRLGEVRGKSGNVPVIRVQ